MPWFESSFRRNLIDIHISEDDPRYLSAFDAEKYAEAVAASGVDTAILYSSSCLGLCYFPTRAGKMHANIAGRDMLAEMLDACRRRGLKTVIYYNIWSRWAYDTHPEWRMRTADGKGYSVDLGQRFGQCCPNTGYSDYVQKQISQLVTDYPCDGLWIDMIGWFDNICYCDGCREKFCRETGREIPTTVDWNSQDWITFQSLREKWFAEMAEMITRTAKSIHPDITVTQQCSSWERGWLGAATPRFFIQSDYLAGDFYCGSVEQSVICKYLNNMSSNRPIEYMVSRCYTLEQHTTNKPRELLLAQRYSALANHTAFVFIDAIDPLGTVDYRLYERMRGIFDEASPFEHLLDSKSELLADVAIFLSQESMRNLSDNGRSVTEVDGHIELIDNAYTIAKTLIEAHITFDVVSAAQLDPERYQILILSDASYLTPKDAEAIRSYVARGGTVYASKTTSILSDQGLLKDFALADVFGAHYKGKTEWDETYLVPVSLPEVFGDANHSYPVDITDCQTLIEPEGDAQVMATLALPFNDPKSNMHFAAALSNPPGQYTDSPAMISHAFGKGRSIYCTAKLETSPAQVHREIFALLLRRFMKRPPLVITDAPPVAEIFVYHYIEESAFAVHILNFQQPLPPVPLRDTTVSLYVGDAEITRAVMDDTCEKIAFSKEGDRVVFRIERTDYFSSVRLYYEKPFQQS